MQCRKGPSAARKGHMATPAGLDLSKAGRAAGPQALGLGSGQSSDRAGVWDLLKDSKPAIKLLQMAQASPRLSKREFPRLKPPKHATHELQLLSLLLAPPSHMLHLHLGPRLKGATQASSGPTSVSLLATNLPGIIRTVFGALVHLCSAYFLSVLPHQLLPMESNRR